MVPGTYLAVQQRYVPILDTCTYQYLVHYKCRVAGLARNLKIRAVPGTVPVPGSCTIEALCLNQSFFCLLSWYRVFRKIQSMQTTYYRGPYKIDGVNRFGNLLALKERAIVMNQIRLFQGWTVKFHFTIILGLKKKVQKNPKKIYFTVCGDSFS